VDFVSNSLSYAGTILQVVLLVLIIRGPLSRYFPLFLYVLSSVAVSVSLAYVLQRWGVDLEHYFPVFWGGELLLDLQLFLLMITLTPRALEGNPLRSMVVRIMGLVALVVLLVPFVAFESRVFTTKWNDSTSQLLNFGAAVMNMALWGALLVNKQRDRQLLTVSAPEMVCPRIAVRIVQFGASCVTCSVCAPIEIVPVRLAAVFAATE